MSRQSEAVSAGRQASADRRPRRLQRRAPLGFLAPFGVMFLVFFIGPIIFAVYESLMTVRASGLGLGPARVVFAKADNYVQVIHDHAFVDSILRVLLFGAVEVPLLVGLALVLALILESASARFKHFFRAAYFAPYGVPGVIGSLLWGFLYTPGLSPIVSILDRAGLHINFLGGGFSLWSIANIVTWEFAGYNMLVVIAQLQSVPHELYEAARVDGAGGFKIAWRIKIPMARPAIVMTAVFSIIGTLQLFAEPLVLQSIDPNISASYTPNLSIYSQAFAYNNYNYAAAQSVILAIAAVILSFGFLKLAQRLGRQR